MKNIQLITITKELSLKNPDTHPLGNVDEIITKELRVNENDQDSYSILKMSQSTESNQEGTTMLIITLLVQVKDN